MVELECPFCGDEDVEPEGETEPSYGVAFTELYGCNRCRKRFHVKFDIVEVW